MKTKWLIKTLLIVFTVITIVSCNKDEEEFNVQSDIYFVNKYVDNERVTGTVYIFYGSKNIDSAIVDVPNGPQQIIKNSVGNVALVKEPGESEYYQQNPRTGVYSFTVYSNTGDSFTGTDVQNFSNLPGAAFTNVSFDNPSKTLNLSWNEIPGCDVYNIKVIDSSDNLIFSSYTINPNVTEFSISQVNPNGFWNKQPVNGETYKIWLQTFLYDEDADPNNTSFNVQEVSIREYEVTWTW